MFLEWVKSDGATTKHLELLLSTFPDHRYKNQIVAELERRAQCQLNSNQANESTEKTQGVGVCQLIAKSVKNTSTFISKMFHSLNLWKS